MKLSIKPALRGNNYYLQKWISAVMAILPLQFALAGELRVLRVQVPIAERGTIMGYHLIIGTNRLFFLPPNGWRTARSVQPGEIRFTSEDLSASISLRVPTGDKPEDRKERNIFARFPNCSMVTEYPCRVLKGEVQVQEAHQQVGRNTVFHRRAVCASPAGLLEVSLSCPQPKVAQQDFAFRNFLNSLRLEPLSNKQASSR